MILLKIASPGSILGREMPVREDVSAVPIPSQVCQLKSCNEHIFKGTVTLY